jgi:hypothetical protein
MSGSGRQNIVENPSEISIPKMYGHKLLMGKQQEISRTMQSILAASRGSKGAVSTNASQNDFSKRASSVGMAGG